MAGLAGDVDLGERGFVTLLGGEKALLHVRRVALGAHEVPVLVGTRPVEGVVVGHGLLRVEVEPALAALFLRARVPDDVQRLVAASGKRDEVLLQGIDAERVRDRVLVELPVGAVRLNEVLAVALEEGRGDAEMRERAAAEVAEDRLAPWLPASPGRDATPSSVRTRRRGNPCRRRGQRTWRRRSEEGESPPGGPPRERPAPGRPSMPNRVSPRGARPEGIAGSALLESYERAGGVLLGRGQNGSGMANCT